MKLLVFTPYYPPHIGGLETHAAQFNYHLQQRGHQVTVFTADLPADAPRDEDSGGIRIIRFPAFEIIPNYPIPYIWRLAFWRQLRALGREHFDSILSRTRFFNTSLIAYIYSRATRTPWLHVEHGSDFVHLHSRKNNMLAYWYDHTLGRLVLRRANRVVANSQASAQFVWTLADRAADVIYRGVDNEAIEQVAPSALEATGPVIAFVGRLIDGKGVHDLFTALGRITSTPLTCLIIGDGPARTALSAQARRVPPLHTIRFLGYQSPLQAVSYLKLADICVNPSYTEGLPTSVIEAALCKKAIVATNVGGTSEIITDEESGLLYPPRDIDALVAKLEQLLADPTRRAQLGQRAYRHVRGRFTWPHSIDRYEDIFRAISLPA